MMQPAMPKCADCDKIYDPEVDGFITGSGWGLCRQCEIEQAKYYGSFEPYDIYNLEEPKNGHS
jgi:hypothetical protein